MLRLKNKEWGRRGATCAHKKFERKWLLTSKNIKHSNPFQNIVSAPPCRMKRKSSRIFRLLCTGTTLILASISPCEAFCVDRLALVPASATHRTAATLSRQQSQLHYHSLDDDDEYIYYQQVPLSEEEKYRQEVVNSFVVASRDLSLIHISEPTRPY